MSFTILSGNNSPSDRHNPSSSSSQFSPSAGSDGSSSAVDGGGVPEVERHRRLDDTYVGIIVGALAIFIVLIVGVSLFIGLRLRRKKYHGGGNGGVSGGFIGVGGGSGGRSPKFVYSRGNSGSKTANGLVTAGNGNGSGVGGYSTIIVEMDNRLNKEMSLLNHHNSRVPQQQQQQAAVLTGRQNSNGSQQAVSLLSPTLNGTSKGLRMFLFSLQNCI